MSISIKTRKMLWGRSANRCNFPGCRIELAMDATETDDESIVGEECHMVARKIDGPRGDSVLTSEQRDKYGNLILMCNVHHKIIDDQYISYSVEKLKNMKCEHEEWVKSALSLDVNKQKDDEIYSTYIDKWYRLAEVKNWQSWTSYMLGSGQPKLFYDIDNNLRELKEWLLSRVWPRRYPELEFAFENFRRVLEDLYNLFHEQCEDKHGMYYTSKFYNIDYWDEAKYSELHKKFEFHVYLVEDLVLELTRAANYICDKIREFVIPSFMINEGMLLVTYGPTMWFDYHTRKVEYTGNERTDIPYPGLEKFKEIRELRDFSFSQGLSWDDPKFLELYDG